MLHDACYVYVCIYVYVCMYVYMSLRLYACVHACVCMHSCMHACMQVDRRQHEDAQERKKKILSGCTVTFAATCTSMRNLAEAELVFCKPLSRAALDAHLLLGATYWSQIVREAQVLFPSFFCFF
jgi:hypothetical protein